MAIDGGSLRVGRAIGIGFESKQGTAEAMPASEQIDAVIAGDGEQPGSGPFVRLGSRPEPRRLREDVLGGIGRFFPIIQVRQALSKDGGKVRLIQIGQPIIRQHFTLDDNSDVNFAEG